MVTPLAIELSFFPDTGARRPAVLVGQTVRSHAGFRTETGALIQPGGVTVTVKRPDGVLVTMPPGQIGLDADGRYRVDLTADVPGTWGVQWRCATPGEAVREREFAAQPQQVVPGDPGPILVMNDLGPPVSETGGVFTARRITYLPAGDPQQTATAIAQQGDQLVRVPIDRIFVLRNTAAVAGSAMGVGWEARSPLATPASGEGALWPTATYAFGVVNVTFNAANTPGSSGSNAVHGGPAAGLLVVARNAGSQADVVGLLASVSAQADGASIFGGNIVVRSGKLNPAGVRYVGLEIDLEAQPGEVVSPESVGLAINPFSAKGFAAAIQIGPGLGGGGFVNGVEAANIQGTVLGLAGGGGDFAPASMLDSFLSPELEAAGGFRIDAIVLHPGHGLRLYTPLGGYARVSTQGEDVVLTAPATGAVKLGATPAANANGLEVLTAGWLRQTARLRTEATYTFFAELAPTLNQVIAAFPVASSGRIPAGLAGSSMLAETAITGVAAVQLWNNATWTTIGTFTFSAGVQPILSGAPVADLPVIEGTHRLRVIATTPWTKAGLEVRLKQL